MLPYKTLVAYILFAPHRSVNNYYIQFVSLKILNSEFVLFIPFTVILSKLWSILICDTVIKVYPVGYNPDLIYINVIAHIIYCIACKFSQS